MKKLSMLALIMIALSLPSLDKKVADLTAQFGEAQLDGNQHNVERLEMKLNDLLL